MNLPTIKFDERGLVPAIVQDAQSKEVLTLAYMNEESLRKSLETGETWFYSRSRKELWHKGATSGNTQRIAEMRYDCDQDALLVLVNPKGPACHTGSYSCFSERVNEQTASLPSHRFAIISQLEQIVAERAAERPEGSYTTYLFEKGIDKILKKVAEEAAEVIIAAKNDDPNELQWEVADLLYHLLVLLRHQKLSLDSILQVLEDRYTKKRE